MPLLECIDLAPGYGANAVCPPLSFSVEPGDYLCVLGENGSGKSTLMRTILGLQKPVAGEVRLGDGFLPNQIGYLPQQTAIQKDFPASVMEVVLSGCQGKHFFQPFYTKAQKEMAQKQLQRLDALGLSRKCYRELSGGQQQRVLLARALCATEKLLLLDEPVSGLDPQATQAMYDRIRDLNRQQGLAIIMISHDIPSALRDATRILRLGNHPFLGDVEEARKTFLTEAPKGGEEA